MVTCDVELSRKAGILVDEFIWRVLSLCSRICPIAGGVVKACKSVQFASSACLIRALGCPPRYIYYGYSTALQLPVRGAAVEFGSTNDGLGSRRRSVQATKTCPTGVIIPIVVHLHLVIILAFEPPPIDLGFLSSSELTLEKSAPIEMIM